MWRPEPQMPVASSRTAASSCAWSSGSGPSSTSTRPGSWNVTASMRCGRLLLAQREHDVDRGVAFEARLDGPRPEQLSYAAEWAVTIRQIVRPQILRLHTAITNRLKPRHALPPQA